MTFCYEVAEAMPSGESSMPPSSQATGLLLSLEIVEQNGSLLRLLSPVLNDHARAIDDLSRVSFTIDLACSEKRSVRVLPGIVIAVNTYKGLPILLTACHRAP